MKLVLLPFVLTATLATSSISSKKASFDGNAVVLQGSVALDHTLGKFQSNMARLQKESKEGPYSHISLAEDVVITLHNRGKISCASADFDFNTMKGKLIPALGKAIHFTNLHADLFSLSSREADIEFTKEGDDIKVSKVQANGRVEAQYGLDFFLAADSATYSNQQTPYLCASPNCTLTHKQDTISAEKIELFPETAQVVLTSPEGDVTPSCFSEQDGIHFSCDKMIWDKAPQVLTLLGNISFHDNAIGEIHCDDEVQLHQTQKEGKWLLNSIKARGKTELRYQLDAPFKHFLTCYGSLFLDQKKLTLTLESPQDQPIEYVHDTMQLLADKGEMHYTQNGQKIEPETLTLFGNVRLGSEQGKARCALADQFTYIPKEEKIILSCSNDTPVLFWDEERGLSISAKEVHIHRSRPIDNIKGVGSVRFTFSSTENALLKKVFPFYRGAP